MGFYLFSLLPLEGGAPKGRRLAFARNDDTGCGILVSCILQNAERAIKKEIPFLRFPFWIQVYLRERTN